MKIIMWFFVSVGLVSCATPPKPQTSVAQREANAEESAPFDQKKESYVGSTKKEVGKIAFNLEKLNRKMADPKIGQQAKYALGEKTKLLDSRLAQLRSQVLELEQSSEEEWVVQKSRTEELLEEIRYALAH